MTKAGIVAVVCALIIIAMALLIGFGILTGQLGWLIVIPIIGFVLFGLASIDNRNFAELYFNQTAN